MRNEKKLSLSEENLISHPHEDNSLNNSEEELLEILQEAVPITVEIYSCAIDLYFIWLERFVELFNDVPLGSQPMLLELRREWFLKDYNKQKKISNSMGNFLERQIELRLNKLEKQGGITDKRIMPLIMQFLKMWRLSIEAGAEVFKYLHENYAPGSIIVSAIEILSPRFLVDENDWMKAAKRLHENFPKPIHYNRLKYLHFRGLIDKILDETSGLTNISLALEALQSSTPAQVADDNFKRLKQALAKEATEDVAGPAWRQEKNEDPYKESNPNDEIDAPKGSTAEGQVDFILANQRLKEYQEIENNDPELPLLRALEAVNPTPRERELFNHFRHGTMPPDMTPEALRQAKSRLLKKIKEALKNKKNIPPCHKTTYLRGIYIRGGENLPKNSQEGKAMGKHASKDNGNAVNFTHEKEGRI